MPVTLSHDDSEAETAAAGAAAQHCDGPVIDSLAWPHTPGPTQRPRQPGCGSDRVSPGRRRVGPTRPGGDSEAAAPWPQPAAVAAGPRPAAGRVRVTVLLRGCDSEAGRRPPQRPRRQAQLKSSDSPGLPGRPPAARAHWQPERLETVPA